MKLKPGIISLVALSTIIFAGCGGSSGDKKTEEYSSKGEELFKNNSCVSCHGKDLEGASGPSLKKVGSKLSQSEIEKIINEGKGSMPSKVLEGKDAKEVAKWLSEQK
ncbi:cytochrome c551 [Mammaliicoccus stepanovicii]|uniref:Cytochrome c551 n=1 Tax=Mammaliicoccus stepanovicii TaxID=643214 RepID=A0A239ZXV5_9STAP|nr:cytochrome c [Mammaliicoccus stepanovicii]PNZ79315.1 cytochrome c [Mammaliicoccus stepanovicii]GGI39225.1 cytochrome c-551 [Mammaliicoccus stepanovicii]SNV75809.1 Cytochrome c551 [Mammaliicoccus stepanovicii]